MTRPRFVIEGATYMVQRRTTQRQFLLKPTKQTCNIFMYVLGLTAKRHRMQIHEFVLLSNHYHIILTDPFAKLSAFMRDFDSLVARTLNASLGRWENAWAPDTFCGVRLLAGEDVLAKAAYTLANPVCAGLVPFAEAWGGCTSAGADYGSVFKATRPNVLFREHMPATTSFTLVRPDVFPMCDDKVLRGLVHEQVADIEQREQERMREAGGRFLGMSAVMRQKTTDTPASYAKRRGMRPTVAGKSKWERVEALQQIKAFTAAHEEARLSFRKFCASQLQQFLSPLFPAGTCGYKALLCVPVYSTA